MVDEGGPDALRLPTLQRRTATCARAVQETWACWGGGVEAGPCHMVAGAVAVAAALRRGGGSWGSPWKRLLTGSQMEPRRPSRPSVHGGSWG